MPEPMRLEDPSEHINSHEQGINGRTRRRTAMSNTREIGARADAGAANRAATAKHAIGTREEWVSARTTLLEDDRS